MKVWSALIFSLIGVSAMAQTSEVPDAKLALECQLNPQFADEVIPSDEVTGDYWSNMLGDHIVLFSAQSGVGTGRFQGYDLQKKVPIRLTQGLDPTAAPDGRRIYIHPSPIRFYEFDTIRDRVEKKGEDPKNLSFMQLATAERDDDSPNFMKAGSPDDGPVAQDNDPAVHGYYESLATLAHQENKKENFSDYRVLTGEGEGSIKDYRVTFGPGDKILKVTELTKKGLALCPNLRNSKQVDLNFDTPILSPVGNEFAVVDRKTQSTVIMGFDPKTGICEKKFDFGFETGKVHFNSDGSKIAFHSNAIANDHKLLSDSKSPRPYLFDRKTKRLTALSVGDFTDDAQGTFPTFKKDGKILYQRSVNDPVTRLTSRAFVTVDPKKLNSIPFDGVNSCSTLPAAASLDALNSLWKSICESKNSGPKTESMNWAMTVDPKVCKKFVESNYAKFAVENPNAISEEAMKRACPTQKIRKRGPTLRTVGRAQTYPSLLAQRCIICHTQGSPHGYIPFDNPEAMRKMNAIGGSAKKGEPFYGKTFVEQVSGILDHNQGADPDQEGIPRVPADGPRLTAPEVQEIKNWVTQGQFGKYP